MIKQVIVIRKDLKMRRGKEIAQGSHASMAFLSHYVRGDLELKPVEREWLAGTFTKICVVVNSEDELLNLHHIAEQNGIRSFVINDSGATEFGGMPTNTCIAIGPDYVEKIDPITRELKLY